MASFNFAAADADDGGDECDEDLEGHPQAQAKATDVDLASLTLQVTKTCRVFRFEMLPLNVGELRLFLKIDTALLSTPGIMG